jgi:dihydrofolate reductase
LSHGIALQRSVSGVPRARVLRADIRNLLRTQVAQEWIITGRQTRHISSDQEDILVTGSSELTVRLLQEGLVDELWIM